MQNTTTETKNQITHIRVPLPLYKRLKRLSKKSNKTVFAVTGEVLKAGLVATANNVVPQDVAITENPIINDKHNHS